MAAPENPRLYLDYAATTPIDPAVAEAMAPFLQPGPDGFFGNPSSLHAFGKATRKALEQARETVAGCLGAKSNEIVFTSGATEADNLAILGLAESLQARGRHIITSAIEHPAVANPCALLEKRGWDVTYLPVDADGFVSVDVLQSALRPETVLVSIIHGHNEIGTLQTLEAMGRLLKAHGVLFHTDAVQTVGKLPFDLNTLPVDYLSLSAHKIYGPKGVGALYIREGAPLPRPLQVGGGQEHDLRSGTESLAGIIGLAKALEIAVQGQEAESARSRQLQEKLMAGLEKELLTAVLNGPRDVNKRVPGNVHISFAPAEGEALVLHFDLRGIALSSGSACHSAVIEPSKTILALGKSEAVARATVRFSIGRYTTEADIDRVLAATPAIVQRFVKKAAPAASP